MTTFSRSIETQLDSKSATSVARRRLHLLYLLNDLLHHTRFHLSDTNQHGQLRQTLQPFLLDLFQLTATDQKKRVGNRLQVLADVWQEHNYVDRQQLERIRNVISGHVDIKSDTEKNIVKATTNATKEQPFIMPATHGDPSLPFYDLPAGNLMPHIIPNSTVPMRPDQITALQFLPGPADDGLVNAVKDFLKDVTYLDNEYLRMEDEDIVLDIDEMGQVSYRNEAGDVVGDTYYGWSRAFCEKMKNRKKGDIDGRQPRSRSRTYSPSPSRSRSRGLRKRPRYSDSPSDRSRDSRAYSPSRSRSPDGRPSMHRPPRRSRSRSYSPAHDLPRFASSSASTNDNANSKPNPISHLLLQTQTTPGSNLNFPIPLLGPDGLPIPPPRPPNWSGIWPPPPPPPMSGGARYAGNPFASATATHLPPQPLPRSSNTSSQDPYPSIPTMNNYSQRWPDSKRH